MRLAGAGEAEQPERASGLPPPSWLLLLAAVASYRRNWSCTLFDSLLLFAAGNDILDLYKSDTFKSFFRNHMQVGLSGIVELPIINTWGVQPHPPACSSPGWVSGHQGSPNFHSLRSFNAHILQTHTSK